jgi:hypothetical protein
MVSTSWCLSLFALPGFHPSWKIFPSARFLGRGIERVAKGYKKKPEDSLKNGSLTEVEGMNQKVFDFTWYFVF